MKKNRPVFRGFSILVIASALTFALSGCSGDDGSQGPAGPAGPAGQAGPPGPGVTSVSTATALNITITGVSINSAPVVNFTVANQNGVAVVGFADTDLRFNIAKLVPGSATVPSKWQSYLNRVSGGGELGTQERKSTGYAWGTLVDHKNGTYTYTFCTDITNNTGTPDFTQCPTAPQPNTCPAPCTDADGNALDISYQPSLTHRVGIQQNNTALPKANATYDFVPAGGAVSTSREIVMTASCNECHNQLAAHGGGMRIETKLCVTCHNPGSWFAGSPNQTVDFKVYIHKIHRGENLPSVIAGTPYVLGSADFSDVIFPQDIRNCTKCHDGADVATPQGDNWETQPSIAACGSCHDDVYFGASPDPLKPYQTVAHPGGVPMADTECVTCHNPTRPNPIAQEHTIPAKVAGAKFKFNLLSVTGGTMPSIQFSVTDPTNADAPYDIASGDATSNPVFKTPSTSRLAIDIGWNTTDFTNNTSGANPAQPISIDPVNACDGTPIADWTCTPNSPSTGVYTLTKSTALPAGAVGTGRVGFEGHPAALDTATPPAYTVRVPVKNVVKDWSIDGSTLTARRTVVDIAKCDKCHDQLSLHGNNRTDEPQLCVMCHNPNDTDANRRPKTGGILSGGVDGKLEESIDFKRMIHGIHGAGMREKGLVVYGFSAPIDFSDVRFPGILNDCTTCHTTSSYQLTGIWEMPTQNGILGSTIRTTPTAVDAGTYATQLATPDDDLNITPTAAVCSSCHDGVLAQQHMIQVGSAMFSDTQATINTNLETCSICHGPGTVADVKTVHGVK